MEIEAFVLIGGKSSRLEQDKALIKLGGVTLAERAVNTIHEAFSSSNISLAARDENQFSVADLPKDVPVIYDTYKDRGAYSGLHAALKQAQSEWIFVLACDYPFVSAELLKFLAGLLDETFDAIVAEQPDGRVQPLCAFYRTKVCLQAVEKILECEGKLPPLGNMLDLSRSRLVKYTEFRVLSGAENFFVNLNSPKDLKQL